MKNNALKTRNTRANQNKLNPKNSRFKIWSFSSLKKTATKNGKEYKFKSSDALSLG